MIFKRTFGTPPRFWLNDVEVDEATYEAADPDKAERLAEMFASGQAASGIITDSTYLAPLVQQQQGRQFDRYRAIAERQGFNTTGKVYMRQLARTPGDPEAFVSGRGDIQNRLEERGWGSDEGVKVTPKEPENPPPSLAGDICPKVLEERTRQYIANSKEPVKDRNEVKEMIREKIRPKKFVKQPGGLE